jgi:CheY-like chemotaxis protein
MPARVPLPPLAAVAHELRTPLHGVIGCAALLADSRLDAEQQAHLAALTEAARAALAFADDAIALARLGAGDAVVPVRAAACDLRLVLAGVVRTLAPLAAARGLALDWDADPAVRAAWADPARVREILLNLGGNAVRATTRGGVRLQLRPDGGGVAIDVIDTGPGLTPAAQARLFRAWHSGDEAAGGAGIGLVLARALAERMGGTWPSRAHIAWAARSPSPSRRHRATCAARRPRTQQRAPRRRHSGRGGRAARRARAPGAKPPRPRRVPAVILLIEDDLVTCHIMTALLKRLRHPHVVAHNGADALEQVGRQPTDLIIADLLLPDMHGLDLIEQLMIKPYLQDIPVMFCSAAGDAKTVERALALGCVDFVKKPINVDLFAARIDRALKRAPGPLGELA